MQGSELKAIRKAVGLKQPEFGEKLGISGPYVGELERGEKVIDARTARAVLHLHEELLPLRVTIGTFGDKYVVILTEAAPGGRVHNVQTPAYDGIGEAMTAAFKLSTEKGVPALPYSARHGSSLTP